MTLSRFPIIPNKALLRSFIGSPEEVAPKPFWQIKARTDDGKTLYFDRECTPTTSIKTAWMFFQKHDAEKRLAIIRHAGEIHKIPALKKASVHIWLPVQYN